jgi:hypothetical protein
VSRPARAERSGKLSSGVKTVESEIKAKDRASFEFVLASYRGCVIIPIMKAARNPTNITDKSPALFLRNRLAAFAWTGAGLCF